MRREIAPFEIYHIYNERSDGLPLFKDSYDFERFLASLIVFNVAGPVRNQLVRSDLFGIISGRIPIEGEPLVKFLAYSLVPTHYHFLIQELVEGGISRFMHRVAMGYTKYLNTRYQRRGRVFAHEFQLKHVDLDVYFKHLPVYIHLNLLDQMFPEWRAGGLNSRQLESALKILEQSLLSSHSAYTGQSIVKIVASDVVEEIYESVSEYDRLLKSWACDERNGIRENVMEVFALHVSRRRAVKP